MKAYSLLLFILLCVFLLAFLLVEQLGVPLLTDPSAVLHRGGAIAALVGVGLLLGDIVLPVPSSLIMMAHGAVFGLALGTVLSLIGGLGAAMIGFGIGRRGQGLIQRYISEQDRLHADQLMQRWGMLAVIVTRPIPLLAEAVSIVAGSTAMRWQAMLGASVLGLVPGAALYAATGAYVVNLESTVLSFVVVLVVALLFWLVGRVMVRTKGNA